MSLVKDGNTYKIEGYASEDNLTDYIHTVLSYQQNPLLEF